MEKIHCDILRKYRRAIIDDVDVNNGIIKPLATEYILKDDDVRRILNGNTKEERVSILLDLLPRCGPFAFDVFIQALKHHYGWLSVYMERYLERSRMTACDTGLHFNDLPPVPPLPVTREEKVNQFKLELQKLKPGKHLALHGLKGFGKSCLTVITLKDANLVADFFQNEIYWIKFCYNAHKLEKRELLDERKIDEDILIQLNVLYQRIKKSDTLPTPLKSEPLKECLIRLIKLHFCQKQHENALLILDDVCHKKIVDTFDVGCKILVITDDLSVVKQKHPITFKVHDGFTEAESLGLFAKVLDIPVDRLPPEAKKIHDECKGMPLLISMFSAQFEDFKEQMIDDRARWKYYLRTLRKRDPENRAIQKRTAIFDMCIDKLQSELKELYYELSIFSEDVNIMPKTLEILWGVEPFDVDERMLVLCHKSLAARQWNDELKSYVYGVHDLLLSHLRMKLNPQILKEKHRSFIQKYRDVCKDDFSKLPDDNYSYSYIGHHLEQAQLYELFEKVYLNLEFVQAKTVNAGLSDLLIDLEKYEKHITRNYSEELQIKLDDLEKFLKDHMSILTKHGIRKCLDIVQIALYHAEEGFVMDQARELASKRSSNLYLSRLKHLGHGSVQSSENISTESTIDTFIEDVSTICFTDDPNALLIATKNGEIVEKNFAMRKTNYIYGFQKKKIIKLILANSENYFLALSDEGKAKLFSLNDEESSDDGRRVQSPREKQTCWTGIFSSKFTQDDSLHTFFIPDDVLSDVAFGPKDKYIAGCTSKGVIRIWKRSGDEFQTITMSNNCCLKKVTFTLDALQNILLHVMDENNCVLITYKFIKNVFEYKSSYNPQIRQRDQDMKIVFFKGLPRENNSLILVTKNKAVHIKWLQSPTHDHQLHSYMKQEKAEIDDPNTFFVSATVTYDGQYLITAKSDGFINVWEIHSSFEPVAVYKGKIFCLDTYWMEEEGYHLFCGNENRLIHKWELKEIEVPKPLSKPLFNALMKPLGEEDMVIRQTSKNRIAVFKGSQASWKNIAETGLVDGSVNTMMLTPDGTTLIYDVVKEQKQEIFLFNIKTETPICIMTLKKASNFIKIITNFESGVAITFQENNKNSLRVWQHSRVCYVVQDTGDVISIHEMDKNRVLTVARNFVIKYWDVCGFDWQLVYIQNYGSANSTAASSNLSPGKSYLALLNEDRKDMVLYNIIKDIQVEPAQVSINVYHETCCFSDKVSCFEFSNDEKYLAIGFDNGDISILDVAEKIEVRKISSHCNPVTELHWAPNEIKVPILLSVNSDDLIWWNVSPVIDKVNKRRSRMGRSISMQDVPSPRSSFRFKNSQSIESKLSISTNGTNGTNGINGTNGTNVSNGTNGTNGIANGQSINGNGTAIEKADIVEYFWQTKITKDQSGLLVLVPLPSNNAKVCVSKDFKKFLTVDNKGCVSTFDPFGLLDIV